MAYNTNNVLVNETDGYVVELKDVKTPMTTAGDIIVGGSNGVPTRLAKGSNGQVLGINGSGNPAWVNTPAPELYLHRITIRSADSGDPVLYGFYRSSNSSNDTFSLNKAGMAKLIALSVRENIVFSNTYSFSSTAGSVSINKYNLVGTEVNGIGECYITTRDASGNSVYIGELYEITDQVV